jgi:hypothetical protein
MSRPESPLMPTKRGDSLPVAYRPPVLSSESSSEYETLRKQFFDEVQPGNIFEEMFTNDLLNLHWEILRYRRCKQGIIDSIRTVALRNVLTYGKGEILGSQAEEKGLAADWYSRPEERAEVIRRLKERNLDELAIEAEAIRLRLEELQVLERLIAGLEARRDKALFKISDFREFFASKLCRASQNVLTSQMAGPGADGPRDGAALIHNDAVYPTAAE